MNCIPEFIAIPVLFWFRFPLPPALFHAGIEPSGTHKASVYLQFWQLNWQ